VKPTLSAAFEVVFTQPALAAVAEEIPTVKRVNERTVRFEAADYARGYRLFRVLYKYLRSN
jgi:D-aminopeptidase